MNFIINSDQPEYLKNNGDQSDIKLLKLGLLLHKEGNLDEAQSIYFKLLKKYPNSENIIHCIGLLFYQMGKLKEAITYFESAIQKNPKKVALYLDLGVTLMENHQNEEALKYFNISIKINPDNIKQYNYKGILLHKEELYFEAKNSFQDALKIDPNETEILNNLGLTLMSLGDYEQSLECFNKSIAIKPSQLEIYLNKGKCLSKLNKLNEEIDNYSDGILVLSDNEDLLLQRGLSYINKNNINKAIADFKILINKNPLNFNYLYQYAKTLKQINNTKESLIYYCKAIEINGNDINSLNDRGILYFELGLINNGREDFKKSMEIDNRKDNVFKFVDQLVKLKHFEEALLWLNKLTLLDADTSKVYGKMGVIYNNLKIFDKALKCYNQELLINNSDYEVYNNRGVLFHFLKRYKEAFDDLNIALQLNPNNPQIQYNLGLIHYEKKQFNSALNSFEKALKLFPNYSKAYINASLALRQLGRSYEAIEKSALAIQIEPNNLHYKINHLINLIPMIPETSLQRDESIINFKTELKNIKIWSKNKKINLSNDEIGNDQLFYLAYIKGNHINELSDYGDIFTKSFLKNKIKFENIYVKKLKIRLLIVSAHIRKHSVWEIIIKGLLQEIDQTKFELSLISLSDITDDETEWAKLKVAKYNDIFTINTRSGWLKEIKKFNPDIIYYPEIGMDSITYYLASQRLAPLQIMGWGHPITSGLNTIDYYFSGELFEIHNSQFHYREKLIKLPGTGCFTIPIKKIPIISKELKNFIDSMKGTNYLVPHLHYKFDPDHDFLYAEIAEQVKNCSFIFINSNNESILIDKVINRIAYYFILKGMDPKKYIKILPWLKLEEFYSLIDHCHILLDCPGFSGYTTAWHCSHRGMPIVTYEGEFMRQRLASGLLKQMKMIDTIATDLQSYIEIAVNLAKETKDKNKFNSRRLKIVQAVSSSDNRIEVIRFFENSLIELLENNIK